MTSNPPKSNENKQHKSATAPLLLVDDNHDDAQLLRQLIGQLYSDLTIVWLQQVEQVLPYLESASAQGALLPSMVLLDLYLPSARRGLQVLQSIKSHKDYKHLPVVVFSRSAYSDDIAQAMSYSADAYVTKPSEPQQRLGELVWLQPYLPQTNVSNRLIV